MSDPVSDAPLAEGPTRCGFAALIGVPNAGKSTLINALVGSKVSIVSRKVQTTRAPVRGIAVQGPAQVIFIDTPGIFAPKRRLDRAMVQAAWGAGGDADAVALLLDARKKLDAESEGIIARMAESKAKRFLVLNKIDTIDVEKLLKLAETVNALLKFDDTFMVSALKGHGVDKFLSVLAAAMPAGPWLYPADQVTDAPLRLFAAEITREKMFERLHEELPYQTTVETDSWTTLPDGSARIEQTIFVTRDGHKKIVIGEGGQTLKSIGKSARKDIGEAAECNVHLFLHVKVRENWLDDPERFRGMGLEFPKGKS